MFCIIEHLKYKNNFIEHNYVHGNDCDQILMMYAKYNSLLFQHFHTCKRCMSSQKIMINRGKKCSDLLLNWPDLTV